MKGRKVIVGLPGVLQLQAAELVRLLVQRGGASREVAMTCTRQVRHAADLETLFREQGRADMWTPNPPWTTSLGQESD